MIRCEDWSHRLTAYIARTATIPFQWGVQDCCLWALGALDAMWGMRHAELIRGQYHDADGAVLYANRRGWKSSVEACQEFCGPPYVSIFEVGDGDLCTRATPDFPWGTVFVRYRAYLIGPDNAGLVAVPSKILWVDSGRWVAFPGGSEKCH
jgi:hypothetical protein